jgi:hypothetical protein
MRRQTEESVGRVVSFRRDIKQRKCESRRRISHKKVYFVLADSKHAEPVVVNDLSDELDQKIVSINERCDQRDMPPVVSALNHFKLQLSVPLEG